MEAMISKHFGEKQLFDNYSFSIPDKGITLLKGPSGCGKTTLLRILAGLETNEKGDLGNFSNKKCGFVFQEPRLIEHYSATENLLLVNHDRGKIRALLEEVGLKGEDTTPVSKYSGGEKARVSILRALLFDADFYLFDEPFSGLDVKNKKILSAIINRELHDKPIILVTHVMDDIEHFEVKKVIEL